MTELEKAKKLSELTEPFGFVYEPREDVKEVDFLAKRINALTDEEFLQLSKLVVRGYENGRD